MSRATVFLACGVAALLGYLVYLEEIGTGPSAGEPVRVARRPILPGGGGADGTGAGTSLPEVSPLSVEIPHDLIGERLVGDGEDIARIACALQVTEKFLRWLNELPAGQEVRPGERMRVVQGPFRAEVRPDRRELAVYLDPSPDPLKSYTVQASERVSPGRYAVAASDRTRGIWLEGSGGGIAIHPFDAPEVELGISLPEPELREVSALLVAGSRVDVQ